MATFAPLEEPVAMGAKVEMVAMGSTEEAAGLVVTLDPEVSVDLAGQVAAFSVLER